LKRVKGSQKEKWERGGERKGVHGNGNSKKLARRKREGGLPMHSVVDHSDIGF